MIKYSILNTDKIEVENLMVRIDEGIYASSIIAFKNIKLNSSTIEIEYSYDIIVLLEKGVECYELENRSDINKIIHDIFNDVLYLFKDLIV